MRRERRKRYQALREIRQERDYHIGKLQYANRPFTKPSLSNRVMATKKFIEKNRIVIGGS